MEGSLSLFQQLRAEPPRLWMADPPYNHKLFTNKRDDRAAKRPPALETSEGLAPAHGGEPGSRPALHPPPPPRQDGSKLFLSLLRRKLIDFIYIYTHTYICSSFSVLLSIEMQY